MKLSLLHAGQLMLAVVPATAQQFPTLKTQYHIMGLSSQCVQVLNTVVDCSDALYDNVPRFQSGGLSARVMSPDAVQAVCVDKCRASLESLRQKIIQGCSASDRMAHDGFSYPATYMADIYLYAYDLSCHKDKTTGRFCDLLLNEWRAKPDESYDYTEEDLKSLTASCSATGYDFVRPSPYSLPVTETKAKTTTSPTTTPSQPCPTPYTIQQGDTCDSLSQAKDVSTFGLINANGFMMPCQPLTAGRNICLPLTCQTHLLADGETCYTLSQQYGVTRAQLINWNDNFDLDCLNIQRWVGTYVCVGSVGAGTPTTTGVPTAAPAPTNAAPHSNKQCAFWHTVVKDEYCSKIANDNSLSMDNFLFLNPDLDAACTKLILGRAYCVRAIGDITTYSGYPTQEPSTVFTKPTTDVTLPTPTMLPHAPGTDPNCTTYVNYVNTSSATDQYGRDTLNKCTIQTTNYQILFKDFVVWNPSLNKDIKQCALQAGYSYCVVKQGTITTSVPKTTTTTTMSTKSTATPAPAPTQDGIVKNCNKFYKAASGDTCQNIVAANYPIKLQDFYKWNPAVKTDCSGLWASYYYCVGVPVAFHLKTWYHNDCTGDVHNDVRIEDGSDGMCINLDCKAASISTDAEGLCPGGQVQLSYWEQPDCTGKWFGYGYTSRSSCHGLWTDGWKFKSLHLRCAKEADDCVSKKTCTYDPEPSGNIC